MPEDILADAAAEVVVTLALRGRPPLIARMPLAMALAAPPGPLAALHLGRAAEDSGDLPGARAFLVRAHAARPDHAEIAGVLARLLLAGEGRDPVQAEAITRPFAAGDAPWPLNARAEALLQLGRLDEAEAVQWRVMALAPQWPSVQERLPRIREARLPR